MATKATTEASIDHKVIMNLRLIKSEQIIFCKDIKN